MRNPICKSPISVENTKIVKNVKSTIFISGTGSFGNVGERSYQKKGTHTRAISEQPLLSRKKGRRELPSDKFKKSQQIDSVQAFQNGRSALFEIPSRTGRFAMQGRSQGGIFSVFGNKHSQKLFRFKWLGNLYEFLCLCFGLRSAPKIYRKLLKVLVKFLRPISV